MSKKINDVSQLPEWFDIEPYTQWRDKDPHRAVCAIYGRIYTSNFIRSIPHDYTGPLLYDSTISSIFSRMADASKAPLDYDGMGIAGELYAAEQRHRLGEDEFAEMEAGDDSSDAFVEARKVVKRIVGDNFGVSPHSNVRFVTMWDAMAAMKENSALIERIEKAASCLSEERGWDIEDVRHVMFSHVSLEDLNDFSYVNINGTSTIEVRVEGIRRYLLKNCSNKFNVSCVKPSEVKKLFEYRAAAYFDLTIWASLTRSKITAKCMASALFPHDDKFGELEMRPSRPVGKFFRRLESEKEYMLKLMKKAEELDSLNF
ncbi:DUF6387 family protein [Marinobacter gelidimuriae]|uniref:DUF6387 family protein n=1 Tax=Marinobacter gelidimuriae TaxID=2739064 RepID=UPI000367FC82|nr:DUF6387 family protein [Marinobacter gelidimuriae]